MKPTKMGTQKPAKKLTLYQLKVTLEDIDRPVWRRVQVPGIQGRSCQPLVTGG